MHKNTKDLTGRKFNHIKILEYSNKQLSKGHVYWKCKCDCGYIYLVRGSHLLDGNTKSCGRSNKCEFAYNLKETDSKRKKAKHNQTGKTNSMWKGINAGYGSKHNWVQRHYKKLLRCEHCKQVKKLDWALKKGCEYENKRKNFLCLCRSCHLKYDYTQERKEKQKIGTTLRWKNIKNKGLKKL